MFKVVNRAAALLALSWATTTVSAAPYATADTELGSSSVGASLPPQAAVRDSRMLQYAARGGEIESVLLREDDVANGQRLTGVTRLSDGTRLWEEARFNRAGALVRAESMCSCPSGATETVVFEVESGVVEVRNASGVQRWSVPNDYPWIWAPHGCNHGSHASSVATPVSALVVMRGAKDSARRLIDPKHFVSHTITSDQVIVPEDAGASWVVLGDDAVLVRDGVPQRWRANALGVDVELR
jgi:hypothetical protein